MEKAVEPQRPSPTQASHASGGRRDSTPPAHVSEEIEGVRWTPRNSRLGKLTRLAG